MLKRISIAIVLGILATPASAQCGLSSSPCSTDNSGNTWRQERNLGNGFSTYRNGDRQSSTTQNLGGGWTERDNYGNTRQHNNNPYGQQINRSRSQWD